MNTFRRADVPFLRFRFSGGLSWLLLISLALGHCFARAESPVSEAETPPLAPDLRNLWNGAWAQEASSASGASDENAMTVLLAEALKMHRAEFERLGPGRRETMLQAIRAALPQEGSLPAGDDAFARAVRRLALAIHPLYERLHRNRMDERFEAARSLDAFGAGPLGESVLSGDLLVDAAAYVLGWEGLNGEAAAARARAIIKAKSDHFIAWIRQRRRPEQTTCGLIWSDWAETDGAFYPELKPSDESLHTLFNELREWYYENHLPSMAERVDGALKAESAFDEDQFPEKTARVIELMIDRDRYAAAFTTWKEANADTLSLLGVDPSLDRDLAAQLAVDPVSGQSINREDDRKAKFLRRAVYGKFRKSLAEVERRRNEQVQAAIQSMNETEQRRAKEALRQFERPAP